VVVSWGGWPVPTGVPSASPLCVRRGQAAAERLTPSARLTLPATSRRSPAGPGSSAARGTRRRRPGCRDSEAWNRSAISQANALRTQGRHAAEHRPGDRHQGFSARRNQCPAALGTKARRGSGLRRLRCRRLACVIVDRQRDLTGPLIAEWVVVAREPPTIRRQDPRRVRCPFPAG
jgi:hypothetical protein